MMFSPKPKTPTGHRLFYSFMILGFGAAAVSTFVPHYKGVVTMSALVFFVLALFYYNKYVATSYRYSVEDRGDGKLIFVVVGKNGKRESTLYSAYLGMLADLSAETPKDRKLEKKKRVKNHRRFYYFPTVRPTESYRLLFRSATGTDSVHIEADSEWIERLGKAAGLDRKTASAPEKTEGETE